MNAKLILFPTDFSSASDAALAYASSLARDMDATLLIAHVEEPPLAYGGGELYYGVPEPDRDEMNRMLQSLKPTDPSVACEYALLEGEPASEVVRIAAERNADMIVMGTHGRTGLSRLLMGSVAEAIVRRASCPVLTIKEPVGAAAEKKS